MPFCAGSPPSTFPRCCRSATAGSSPPSTTSTPHGRCTRPPPRTIPAAFSATSARPWACRSRPSAAPRSPAASWLRAWSAISSSIPTSGPSSSTPSTRGAPPSSPMPWPRCSGRRRSRTCATTCACSCPMRTPPASANPSGRCSRAKAPRPARRSPSPRRATSSRSSPWPCSGRPTFEATRPVTDPISASSSTSFPPKKWRPADRYAPRGRPRFTAWSRTSRSATTTTTTARGGSASRATDHPRSSRERTRPRCCLAVSRR